MSLSPQEKLILLKRMGKIPYDKYEEEHLPLREKFLRDVKDLQGASPSVRNKNV